MTLEFSRRSGTRRWVTILIAALVGCAVGAACVWATLTVLRPAEDPLSSAEHTFVEVIQGEVGASLRLSAVAEWKQEPIGVNRASGVLTSVAVGAGAEVSQGSSLYAVGLRPVVVAEGAVPMFRSIGDGVEGEDVEQLQQLLRDLGYYGGVVDGKAGDGTVRAIAAWQKALGLASSGEVQEGDVIFVPSLPSRVLLDAKLMNPGATLTGGENVLLGLSTEPEFHVPATDSQAARMPAGTRVEITSPKGDTWEAYADTQARNAENGTVLVSLSGKDGGAICSGGCAQLPVSGATTLSAQIIAVEPVSGLVVPSSALITTANGETELVDSDGDHNSVTVVASANGMSVVTGVAEGLRVRVPAEAGDAG